MLKEMAVMWIIVGIMVAFIGYQQNASKTQEHGKIDIMRDSNGPFETSKTRRDKEKKESAELLKDEYFFGEAARCRPNEIGGEKKRNRRLTERKVALYVVDPYLAERISMSQFPFEIAAIKLTESGYSTNTEIRGDHGESIGLYQIQERHWGPVQDTISGQTEDCERILRELGIDRDRSSAVRMFNGSGPKAEQYKRTVLALADKIQKSVIIY